MTFSAWKAAGALVTAAGLMLAAACGGSPVAAPAGASSGSAAAAGSTAPASGGDLLAQVKARGYIDIGVFNNAPQTSIDPTTGKWVGIDAEIAAAVAKQLGVQFRPHVYDLASIVPAVTSGRVDLADALAQTDERKKVVSFSTSPIWWSPTDIVVRNDSGITSVQQLAGKTIAVPTGSAQVTIANLVQKKYNTGEVKQYKDFNATVADVDAGRADAMLLGRVILLNGQKKNPDQFGALKILAPLGDDLLGRDDGVYYTFRKDGSDSLNAAISAALKKIQTDGTAAAIFKKYDLDNTYFWTGK